MMHNFEALPMGCSRLGVEARQPILHASCISSCAEAWGVPPAMAIWSMRFCLALLMAHMGLELCMVGQG